MKIIEKYKQLDAKVSQIPLKNYLGVVPLVEFLLILPILLSTTSAGAILVLGVTDFFSPISGFSFYILKLAVLFDSLVLKILSVIPFALKLIFLIFSIRGKRKFVLYNSVLYILDFVFSLVFFATGNYGISVLQTQQLTELILRLVILAIYHSLFFVLFVCYKRNINYKLKNHPKEIRKKVHTEIARWVTVFITLTAIVFAGVWISDSKKTATKDEVVLLNKCCEYSQEFLYNELPQDREKLEEILADIDGVIETDVFKKAFNQSEYKNRILEAELDEDETVIVKKSEYANELIFLKCKILLELNKNEEYLSYYKENYKFFCSIWTESYFQYVIGNEEFFTEEQNEIIKKGYIEVLAFDATDFEKYEVFRGLCSFYKNDKGLEKEEFREELEKNGVAEELDTIYKDSFENVNYVKEERFIQDSLNWENISDKFYILQ